jgi:hypothetical protein
MRRVTALALVAGGTMAVVAGGTFAHSRRRLGRGLTAEELERVLRRYPGDLQEPQQDDRPA